MNHQQDLFIDAPRGRQLDALRRIEFETYSIGRNKVSARSQKAVLRAVDDHEGQRECFATQETIAAEVGCSVSTVVRAIAALVDQDILTKERPNGFSSNRHRVVWSSVFLKVGQDANRKTSTERTSKPNVDNFQVEGGELPSGTRRTSKSEAEVFQRNRQVKPNLTDHLTAPWLAVVATMKNWGLASAQPACQAAKARGLSIEYVAELFREAGGDREPERWSPGQLSNWLTGKTPLPFDEAEAIRRIESRQASQANEAQRIRELVNADATASGVPQWVADGTTFRRLRDAGMVGFATDAEVEAAGKMDAIDRTKRQPKGRVGRLGGLLGAVN